MARFSLHVRLQPGSAKLAPVLGRRVRNLKPLLSIIGKLGVADAQRAFTDQRLGKDQWPGRYPNKSEPFVNVAGAIRDLTQGPTIKPRRFTRRPAGFDTGRLFNSITYEVKQHSVQIGSPEKVDYATRFAHGGVSRIPITPTVKKNLAKALKKARKTMAGKKMRALFGATAKARFAYAAKLAPHLADKKPSQLSAALRASQRGVRAIAMLRLGFLFRHKDKAGLLGWLFRKTSLKVTNVPRPFLGPSAQGEREMRSAIVTYFKQAAG